MSNSKIEYHSPVFSVSNMPNYQNIAEEMENLLNRQVIIMDAQGYIVAGTDARLIGIYNEGARKVIEQKLTILITKSDSNIYPRAKEGIILPILIEGEIIGAIGIAGTEIDIETYGKIIQLFICRMIEDTRLKRDLFMIDEMKRSFIYNWLYQTSTEDWKSFELRGQAFGININLVRIVCTLSIIHKQRDLVIEDVFKNNLRINIESTIRRCVDFDSENVAIGIGANYYVVLLHESKIDKAKIIANEIVQILKDDCDVQVAVGLGSPRESNSEIQQSFREARIACNISERSKECNITAFDQLDLEVLLSIIPKKSKSEFFNKIYHNCDNEDIDQTMELLRVYIKNNGSILKAASDLHIHKNTLQYQINRLIKHTGYDARNLEDIVPLFVSLKLYDEGYRKG